MSFDLKTKNSNKINIVDHQEEANKFFNFFKTFKGQRMTGGLAVLSSVVAFAYHMAPHTYFREWSRGMYQGFTNGFPTSVKAEIKECMQAVMLETGKDLGNVDLFVLSTVEPYAWGSIHGGLLGYPEFLHWRSGDEVPLTKMRFGAGSLESIKQLAGSELESKAAKAFADSLVLSEDARKFALTREVARLELCPHHYIAVLNSLVILMTYNLARFLNSRLDLFKRPPIIRGSMYNFLALGLGLVYFVGKDLITRRVEIEMDRRAANISTSYAKGGVEYYSKLMKRNRALRVLQPNLASNYTLDGDFTSGLLRKKTSSLVDRLDICERRA